MSELSKEEKKKAWQVAYTKKYNHSRNLAIKELIALHQDEFNLILAGEKIKVGILPRSMLDVYDKVTTIVRKDL